MFSNSIRVQRTNENTDREHDDFQLNDQFKWSGEKMLLVFLLVVVKHAQVKKSRFESESSEFRLRSLTSQHSQGLKMV